MLNFTHCMVDSGEKIAEVIQISEHMLSELLKEYRLVFTEP